MRVLKKLKPGAAGTLRYQQRFKERLVCVRYREDLDARRRYTTVELIVAARPVPTGKSAWRAAGFMHPNRYVLIRVVWGERELALRIRSAGGQWIAEKKRWKLSLKKALDLGLEERIEAMKEGDKG